MNDKIKSQQKFIIENGLTRLVVDDKKTNYAVHPSGKLYSLINFKEVIGTKKYNKSTNVHINISGKQKSYTKAYLIALAFIKKPSAQYNYVHHINGNNYDDNVKNLEWQTKKHYTINGEYHVLVIGKDLNQIFISQVQAAKYLSTISKYAFRTLLKKVSKALKGEINDVDGYQVIAMDIHNKQRINVDKLFIDNTKNSKYKKAYYNGMYFPYLVNRFGNVYSLIYQGKKIKPEYAKNNSLRVRLSLDKKVYIVPVDQLVAQSFNMKKENINYSNIKHINNNNKDNRLANLYWIK
ncbi:hypothetical protein DY052_07450 [Apilactobacillus timberlakei]|uniref:hypothetical protein n=1 Tax=Apilactobacillus timberlakei TaxID=2008380 RepID=UPI00112D718E|nr:hypothetical protein [Apilactobacillus timberlakei]TPR13688.1 hypothetical protein DY052_07450 [Apilactobacillus timberlakei]